MFFFCELLALASKLLSALGHPTQVSTHVVELAAKLLETKIKQATIGGDANGFFCRPTNLETREWGEQPESLSMLINCCFMRFL